MSDFALCRRYQGVAQGCKTWLQTQGYIWASRTNLPPHAPGAELYVGVFDDEWKDNREAAHVRYDELERIKGKI